jgi:hypothetical protein
VHMVYEAARSPPRRSKTICAASSTSNVPLGDLALDQIVFNVCCYDALFGAIILKTGFSIEFISGYASKEEWNLISVGNVPFKHQLEHRSKNCKMLCGMDSLSTILHEIAV